jgi:hypothetical protein
MRHLALVVVAGALAWLLLADRAVADLSEGSMNCGGCHKATPPVSATLKVTGDDGVLTPPGGSALKAFRVQPGGSTKTLSAAIGSISSGKFYVETKGFSNPGLMNKGALGFTNTGWIKRTANEGIYYTDSSSAHVGPVAGKTYNFAISVLATTKPDYYRLAYAVAGKGGGEWNREEAFYLAVFDGGDTDSNGKVDIFDVATIQTKYGTTSGATWADGDFDGNGTVDIFDVAQMQTNYGKGVSMSATAVPEPSTLVLAGLGLAALAGCVWRRRR